MGLMKAGYDAYGEVFTVPVLHKKITFLIGPHVSAHFYKATDDDMSQKEVQMAVAPSLSMPSFSIARDSVRLCSWLRCSGPARQCAQHALSHYLQTNAACRT